MESIHSTKIKNWVFWFISSTVLLFLNAIVGRLYPSYHDLFVIVLVVFASSYIAEHISSYAKTNQASKTSTTVVNKRPMLITTACILGISISLFLIVILLILAVVVATSSLSEIFPGREAPSLWFLVFTIIVHTVYVATLILILKMRKSGLVAYTGTAAIYYVIGFTGYAGSFVTIYQLIITVFILVLLWTQYKKMS